MPCRTLIQGFCLTRATVPPPSTHLPRIQQRSVTMIKRPRRPYMFTQIVMLSDGSSYVHRTTSPTPVYSSVKDLRNSPVWNPSNLDLQLVETDEAGRLKAFRSKFGRGWDAKSTSEVEKSGEMEQADYEVDELETEDGRELRSPDEQQGQEEDGDFFDLIGEEYKRGEKERSEGKKK